MQSLGVLGGTFDPPHIAHLVLASEAQVQLSLERVLWVLTPDPPHKPDQIITPLAIRTEMVQAAIHDNPVFEFCGVDIDRDPPYYAADTMLLLRERYPEALLTYLMGADSLRDLAKWHQPELFIQLCDSVGVMRRPGVKIDLGRLKTRFPQLTSKIRLIDVPMLEFSSSEIRKRIAQGGAYRYFLPEEIYRLVLKYHLYR